MFLNEPSKEGFLHDQKHKKFAPCSLLLAVILGFSVELRGVDQGFVDKWFKQNFSGVTVDKLKSTYSAIASDNKYPLPAEADSVDAFKKVVCCAGLNVSAYNKQIAVGSFAKALFLMLVSHGLVELLCEIKDVFTKVDGKRPEWKGWEVFAKNVAARIASCGKDGAINRWSIPKILLKSIFVAPLKAFRLIKIDFLSFFIILFVVSCLFEFACELKDRYTKNSKNSPGREGFFKDWRSRAIDGKKNPNQETSWTNIGKFPIKLIITIILLKLYSNSNIRKNFAKQNVNLNLEIEFFDHFKKAIA